MNPPLTQSEIAKSFVSVYRDIAAPPSGTLTGELTTGLGIAREVGLLNRLIDGHELSSTSEFRLYMKLTLAVVCLDAIAGSSHRGPRTLPRIESPQRLGRVEDRRGLLLREPSSKVDDWMLEQRTRAWAASQGFHIDPPPCDGRKAEFVLLADPGTEAVECKRRNRSGDDDEGLHRWIWQHAEEASGQLSSPARGSDCEKTLVLDISAAADQKRTVQMPTGHRMEVLGLNPARLHATLDIAARYAERFDIDTVILTHDEAFLLRDRPAAIRMNASLARVSIKGTGLRGMGWTVMLPIKGELEDSANSGSDLQVHSTARSDAWISMELGMVGSPRAFWGKWEWHDADDPA